MPLGPWVHLRAIFERKWVLFRGCQKDTPAPFPLKGQNLHSVGMKEGGEDTGVPGVTPKLMQSWRSKGR